MLEVQKKGDQPTTLMERSPCRSRLKWAAELMHKRHATHRKPHIHHQVADTMRNAEPYVESPGQFGQRDSRSQEPGYLTKCARSQRARQGWAFLSRHTRTLELDMYMWLLPRALAMRTPVDSTTMCTHLLPRKGAVAGTAGAAIWEAAGQTWSSAATGLPCAKPPMGGPVCVVGSVRPTLPYEGLHRPRDCRAPRTTSR